MKAILEFDLPEDRDDHLLAVKAIDWYSVIWDLDQWLRDEIKYSGSVELVPAREKLHDLLRERGISLEDMA